jgi:hypothetical protein
MKKIVYAGVNVIKAAYFVIIIVLLSLFIVVGFLVPNTKEYLVGNQYLKKSEANYKNVSEKYIHTKEELEHITVQNQNLISALERHFEPNSFLNRYRTIFKDARIENTNEKYKEGEFSIQEYKMNISIDQPKAFYFFLDSLKKDPNLIKVKDDIIFQRTESGVDIELYLKIYNK